MYSQIKIIIKRGQHLLRDIQGMQYIPEFLNRGCPCFIF